MYENNEGIINKNKYIEFNIKIEESKVNHKYLEINLNEIKIISKKLKLNRNNNCKLNRIEINLECSDFIN